MGAVESYRAFKKELAESSCLKCGLSEARTHIVVDRGNPEAGVLFIGEAPGESEDLQGKAFVGRSGQLLDRMLLELGFDTNRDALIANVVKCRPPDNRKPKPEEAAACFPFLKKQIDLVKPRIIALLGATALRYLVPEKKNFSMAREAGLFFTCPAYPDARFFVLYHPAYILRDPRKRSVMQQHLRVFKDYWSELKVSMPRY